MWISAKNLIANRYTELKVKWKKLRYVTTDNSLLACSPVSPHEIGWLCHISSFLLFLFSEQSLAHFSAFIWCVCVLSFCLYTRRLPLIHHLTASEGAWEARHVAPSRPTLLFLLFHRERERARGRPPTRPRLYVTFAQAAFVLAFCSANSTPFMLPAKRWIRNPLLCFAAGVTQVNLLLLSRNSLMLFAWQPRTQTKLSPHSGGKIHWPLWVWTDWFAWHSI